MSEKTVYIGMSGGVDSSLSAALLKEQGYIPVGVFMKNWTADIAGMSCSWREDYQDAKRVASKLGIELRVYDFQKQYREKVVDYMVEGYRAGRTPNPDIVCNQEVKFKLFLETALSEGATYISTGHYVRSTAGRLYMGTDTNKDQSYFLYRVSKQALQKSLFPIGSLVKSQVREMAKDRGLSTADKKDSQGICFVGKVGIKEFLLQELGTQPHGPIVDQNGKEIGKHDGALFYTIGQRHGLQLGGGLPYYVVDKNMDTNTVYVSQLLDDERMWRSNLSLADIHWIREPHKNQKLSIRTRYRAPLIDARVDGNTVQLAFPVRAITAGQSAVIYDRDEVLGGGIIQ